MSKKKDMEFYMTWIFSMKYWVQLLWNGTSLLITVKYQLQMMPNYINKISCQDIMKETTAFFS